MSDHTAETEQPAVDALLDLVVETGWRALDLPAIAARTGIDEAELYRLYAGKAGIVNAYTRAIDLAACSGYEVPPVPGEDRYDRLLDILMQRFEAMTPRRAAVRTLADSLPRDPGAMAVVLPQMLRSMTRMAEAAGLPVRGLRGAGVVKILAGVWLATQRTWLADESPDLTRTMAALDRNLRRAWPFLSGHPGAFLPRRRRGPPRGADEADDPIYGL